MVYVALLRGINVGGNNKVDMKQLKAALEQAGMRHVVTYINSGNIVFSSSMEKEQLATLVERVILDTFGLHIKALLRNFEEYESMMQLLPETWTNDAEMKSDVLFLWREIDKAEVLDELPYKEELETVIYSPGAVLWSVNRIHATKSGMSKIIGTKLYSLVTIRNVNTTRKIYALMKEALEVEKKQVE